MRHIKKTLVFTEHAWYQMHYLAEACSIEISAMGYLQEGTDNVVEGFVVPKQTCTGVSTVMDSDDLLRLQLQMQEEHGVDLSRWCVWWHSHVNMGVSPSGTDEDNIENLASGRFLWSVITNKAAAALAIQHKEVNTGLYIRLDLFDPKEHSKHSVHRLTLDGSSLEYAVIRNNKAWRDWAKKEEITAVEAPKKYEGRESWRHLTPVESTGKSGVQSSENWRRVNNYSTAPTGVNMAGEGTKLTKYDQGRWDGRTQGKEGTTPVYVVNMLERQGLLDTRRAGVLRDEKVGTKPFLELIRREFC